MSRGLIVLVIIGAVLAVGTGITLSAAFMSSPGPLLPGFGSLGSGVGYIEIEGTISDSRNTVRQLKAHEKNPLVKAILIRVDSPGGVVTPSHEIYDEIRRIRDAGTPVVVSMGTLAASGGYYVSCPADVIVANPGTLTGSIGVIMEFPVVRELMDKVGVEVEVIKSDVHKDIGSPFRFMGESDRELLQGVVADVYDQFVEVVSTERDLPEDEVRAIADGRIFSGRQALDLGLVDTLGTLEDAKRIVADLAGIKGEPRLIRPRPRLKPFFSRFLEEAVGRVLGWPTHPRLSYIWR